MNETVEKYLNEYADVVDNFLKNEGAILEKNFFFFKNFFLEENLQKVSWSDLQEMGSHIHSFNSTPIAKSNALGRLNQPIEKYREAIYYLVFGTDPIEERINNIQAERSYSLPFFGRSALSELACYSNPDKYLFLNARDVEAAKFLGIEIKYPRGSKAGDKFITFNESIKPIFETYKKIIGKRTKTTIPLEVDQFLSWVYINYVSESEDISEEDNEEVNNISYWIFAPGKDANKWSEFLRDGIMGIGWEFLGDLRKYKSKAELVKAFQQSEGDLTSHKNDVRTCWDFCNEVKIGDIIISKKGRTKYLGYGVVESDYKFNSDNPEYKNLREVRWINSGEWIEQDGDIVLKTLTNITKYKDYVQKLKNLLGIKDIEENIEAVLRRFLDQAYTENLRTADYPKSFQGLTLKVSFGQGNVARIPWISFLGRDQSTSNGIYPVYLLFKEHKKLILAFGVSETNHPKFKWGLGNDSKTINQYFNQIGTTPDRYGDSYVYKVYDIEVDFNYSDANNDLKLLITQYKAILEKNSSLKSITPIAKEDFQISKIYSYIQKAGILVSPLLVTRLSCALLAKPFLILTGLSGSGKTKVAQSFCRMLCESGIQHKVIAVGADWTNREPLLGFPNALISESYIKPDNGALTLIMNAIKEENRAKPFFLILDEMNLSHVERYFADFLSSMESGESIHLHNGIDDWEDVPSAIRLPKNLFIIGTVNIDETTYMFSPKVLDRSNVIEFRVNEEEMGNYLGQTMNLNMDELDGQGAGMATSFVELANNKNLQPVNPSELREELLKFFTELKKTGAEFGYRSASEIYRFAAVVNQLDPSWELSQIIDAAVMQKLLPKVHGSRRKLEPVLKALGGLCLNNAEDFDNYIKSSSANNGVKYPVSLEKISRMYQALLHNGFTSYAEA